MGAHFGSNPRIFWSHFWILLPILLHFGPILLLFWSHIANSCFPFSSHFVASLVRLLESCFHFVPTFAVPLVDSCSLLFPLAATWVGFWQGRPPFCVAFASGHNMLHDSAVLRDMDPMNGVAATLLPKRNVILGQGSGGSCPLQQFSRNHDHYKRGQDPNALVFNVDGRFESLKRNSAAAVQVLLQGRADPNLATGRRLCRSVC